MRLELERRMPQSSPIDFFYYQFKFSWKVMKLPCKEVFHLCSIILRQLDNTLASFQCFLAWQFDALYFNHLFCIFIHSPRFIALWRKWPCQIHISCSELVFSNHYLCKWTCDKDKSFNQSFLFVLSESSLSNFIFDKLGWWRENETKATFWII